MARIDDDELGPAAHAIDDPVAVKAVVTTGDGVLRPDYDVLGYFHSGES
jgi:hypothetical protein